MGVRERQLPARAKGAPVPDPPPEICDVNGGARTPRRKIRSTIDTVELGGGDGVDVDVVAGLEEPGVGGDGGAEPGVGFIGREREAEAGERESELGAGADEEAVRRAGGVSGGAHEDEARSDQPHHWAGNLWAQRR